MSDKIEDAEEDDDSYQINPLNFEDSLLVQQAKKPLTFDDSLVAPQ